MSYGRRADQVAGALSRLLHLRAAKEDTVADLRARYSGLAPDVMFPAPPAGDLQPLGRTLLDRATRMSTLSWPSAHEVISPEYDARHRGEYSKNLTAWARWYRPDGRRRDHCLVYVHGWLEPGSWVEEATMFRKWGRALDVDFLHVALPFHGRREPKGSLFSGEYFWTADLVRSVEGVRQAVCDARAAIGWLRNVGYRTVGVTGISLGGAIDMILACVEPLPDYVIPIVAHLKLEDAVEHAPILWRMKQDLHRFGLDEGARRELFRAIGWSGYAPLLAPDRQLWIQAEDDEYIGADLVREQWEAWDRPGIFWIEGGHMTFPLHLDAMTAAMRDFVARVAR